MQSKHPEHEISKKQYKLICGANGVMYGIELSNDCFYVDFLIVTNENQFINELKLQQSQKVKIDKGMSPIILQVSESGQYGIISCQDKQLQSGQLFFIINTGKKIIIKPISLKQFDKCVTSITFIPKYNALTGMQGSVEVIENNSPEALVGTSDGQIYVIQWGKNGMISKKIGQTVASQICQLEGKAPNMINGIHILCINSKTFSNFCNNTSDKEAYYNPETKEWHKLLEQLSEEDRKNILRQLNIVIVSIICGISVQIYKQNCDSAFSLKIDEETQVQLLERAEFIRLNQAPQENYSILQTYANNFTIYWAVQSRSGDSVNISEIKINPYEIAKSAISQLKKQVSNEVIIMQNQLQGIQMVQLSLLKFQTADSLNGIVSQGHFLHINGSKQYIMFNLITHDTQFQNYGTSNITQDQVSVYQRSPMKQQAGKQMDIVFASIYIENCYFSTSCDKSGTIGVIYEISEELDLWKWFFSQKQFQLALNNSYSWDTTQIITKEFAYHCIESATWDSAEKAAQLFAATEQNIFNVYEIFSQKNLFHAAASYAQVKLRHHIRGQNSVFSTLNTQNQKETVQKSNFTFRQLLSNMVISAMFQNIQLLKQIQEQRNEQILEMHHAFQASAKSRTHVQQIMQYSYFNRDFFQNNNISELISVCQAQIENFIYKDKTKYSEEQKYIDRKELKNICSLYQMEYIYDSYIASIISQDKISNIGHIPQNLAYNTIEQLIKQSSQRNKVELSKKILKSSPPLLLTYFSNNIDQEMALIQQIIPSLFNLLISKQNLSEHGQLVRKMLTQRIMKLSKLDIQYILHYFSMINNELEASDYFREAIKDGIVNIEIVAQISKKYQMNKMLKMLQNTEKIQEKSILNKLYLNTVVKEEDMLNVEGNDQIYFGIEKETLIQRYLQSVASNNKVNNVEKRLKYDQLFKYFQSLKLEASDDYQDLFQKKIILRIFTHIKQSGCYKLTEALNYIPNDYNIEISSELIKYLFRYNIQEEQQDIFTTIKEQRNIIQQNQLHIFPFPHFDQQYCHQCGILLNQKPRNKKNSQIIQMIVFPCGHCFHDICYIKFFAEKNVPTAKAALKALKAANNDTEALKIQRKCIQNLPAQCQECDFAQIPDVLELL